jgi:quercetin dioxygenase-like cupin family protein
MAISGGHQWATAAELAPYNLLEGILARTVHGAELSLALVDLAPSLAMPEHRHPQEQLGIVVRGELTLTIGDSDSRVRRPGDMWVIPSDVPHSVAVGPEGCTVVEAFSPPRSDWEAMPRRAAHPGAWPEALPGG